MKMPRFNSCIHAGAAQTPPQGPEIRIIIPAHNEDARIEPTVREYCEHFGARAVITVITNACTDSTASIVHALSRTFANLELVDISASIGKGGAIRVGFTLGNEPFIGFTDADQSTSAAEFARLLNVCNRAGACGVIGSRWKRGAHVMRKQSLARRIASRIFNRTVVAMFALPFYDTQCGAKVFRRDAIRGGRRQLSWPVDDNYLGRLRA